MNLHSFYSWPAISEEGLYFAAVVEKTCLNDIQSLSASEAQVGLPFLSDLSFHDSGTDGSYFIGGFP